MYRPPRQFAENREKRNNFRLNSVSKGITFSGVKEVKQTTGWLLCALWKRRRAASEWRKWRKNNQSVWKVCFRRRQVSCWKLSKYLVRGTGKQQNRQSIWYVKAKPVPQWCLSKKLKARLNKRKYSGKINVDHNQESKHITEHGRLVRSWMEKCLFYVCVSK